MRASWCRNRSTGNVDAPAIWQEDLFMKTILAAFALLSFASGTALAHDNKECSLSTLRGDHVFSASGYSLINGA
jgi:hypothetical protein